MAQIKKLDTNQGQYVYDKSTDEQNERMYMSYQMDFNNQK